MKKIINYLLSLFGFGKKNNEANKTSTPNSGNVSNFWDGHGIMNTTSLREELMNAADGDQSKSVRYDVPANRYNDLKIDKNLIAPYKSQTDKVKQVLIWNTIISTNEAFACGISRLPKVISEMRKDGWSIRTFIMYQNGSKRDVIYVLYGTEETMLAGETAVVK